MPSDICVLLEDGFCADKDGKYFQFCENRSFLDPFPFEQCLLLAKTHPGIIGMEFYGSTGECVLLLDFSETFNDDDCPTDFIAFDEFDGQPLKGMAPVTLVEPDTFFFDAECWICYGY